MKYLKSQYFFLLYGKTSKFLESLDYSDKDIPDITNETIHYLKKKGKCICGADLTTNPKCMKNLEELLAFLPPESIGNQIRAFNSDVSEQNNTMEDARKQYVRDYDNYIQQSDIRDRDLSEIESLKKKITDNSPEDYKETCDYLKRELEKLKKTIGNYTVESKRIEGELQEANGELEAVSRLNEENRPIREQMEYVNRLAMRADKLYYEESKRNLEEMRELFKKVFSDMYHGNREVLLSDDYRIVPSPDSRYTLDPSKGLETVINFAFVASLLKMAKER